MKTKHRWLGALVAFSGVGICVAGTIGFILTVKHNNLPWSHGGASIRDHYSAVGQSYAQGFTMGFFLCLFLTMTAIALTSIMKRQDRN